MSDNKKKTYRSSFPAETIDEILSRSLQGEQLTQAEYDAKKAAGTRVYGRIYRIYGDMRKQRLLAIYDGVTLVARRDTSKRRGFPLVFPFIFGS